MKTTTRYSGKSGIYVCVTPVYGMRRLLNVITPLLPPDFMLDLDEAHCTLMYSRYHQPHQLIAVDVAEKGDRQFDAMVDSIKQWPGHDQKGYLVAALYSDDLQARHRHWLATGAVHSFPTYEPHVTLASGYGSLPAATLKTINKAVQDANLRLAFGGENFEDIKE